MEHYQRQMLVKADEIGACGGSDTMRYISTVCDELSAKCSRLDNDNKLLAALALIEAFTGSKRVLSVINQLSYFATYDDENGNQCAISEADGVKMWQGENLF